MFKYEYQIRYGKNAFFLNLLFSLIVKATIKQSIFLLLITIQTLLFK